MGTSKASSDINSVLKSIEEQIKIIFQITNADEEFIEKSFKDKLFYISDKYMKNKKLIIFLDSIDQLSEQNYNLSWFFSKLPKNVKIIYSVLKEYKSIFKNLKRKIKSENILEIKPLKHVEAKRILSSYLKASKRQLTSKQMDSVNQMIDNLNDICPLQIKLIFDIVSKWKSSICVPEDFIYSKTSIELIKYHFRIIEKDFIGNEILFKHCLFYLSLFEYRGISENELEDILSIDDELLDSIFIYQHPPMRRFPMALWFRLKHELNDYITNKMTDDTSVVAW
jgi:hypothetical protein